jgi:hypothetical protein
MPRGGGGLSGECEPWALTRTTTHKGGGLQLAGEHHAGMGNGTHNLLIGGHESLPPSQGPWCLIITSICIQSYFMYPMLEIDKCILEKLLFKIGVHDSVTILIGHLYLSGSMD